MNQYYKNTVRPGRKLDVRRILRQEPAFFQIITKRDTSSGRIVWRLSPDLLKRSSDIILEDDILEVRIEQFPEAFNSVTQLAPSSLSSLPIGPEEALPFGHPGFTPHFYVAEKWLTACFKVGPCLRTRIFLHRLRRHTTENASNFEGGSTTLRRIMTEPGCE